ncbi:uncharacterized protein RBU33_019415 isoform 1-T2 [Hipposideros larvatus]
MKLEGSLRRRVAGTFGFPSLDLSCLSLSGGGGCRCSTSQPGQDVLLLLLLLLLPGREKDTAERRGHPGQGAPEELPPGARPLRGCQGLARWPLRSNEQAERGWEVINTSGKCCGGGDGCDRCQAASGKPQSSLFSTFSLSLLLTPDGPCCFSVWTLESGGVPPPLAAWLL